MLVENKNVSVFVQVIGGELCLVLHCKHSCDSMANNKVDIYATVAENETEIRGCPQGPAVSHKNDHNVMFFPDVLIWKVRQCPTLPTSDLTPVFVHKKAKSVYF